LYPVAYISHFYFGPLFEEAGWRGFALPRLQQQRGPLVGTLILGFLWGVWHLPVYLPQDIQADGVVGGLLNFALFVLLTMALAFIFTWVFNNTKGSLLLVILLHGSIDGTSTYIQVLADRHLLSATAVANILQLGFLPGCIVLALLLIVFTRGRLSYQRYQQEAESLDLPPSMEQKPAPPDTAV
jgi:membrane protease YdiL (CAAX protease family)